MKRRVRMRLLLGAVAVVMVTSLASACSPIYVIRAGIAEAKILRARRPAKGAPAWPSEAPSC